MGLAPIAEVAGGAGARECVAADGLIDPSQFACRARDLQPSRVDMAADDLTRLGSGVRWKTTGIASDWAGMRPWYMAPEQERTLALMQAPANDARDLEESLRGAAHLLITYAGELAPIQRTLAELEWRANAFRARVRGGVLVPVSESLRPTLLQSIVGLAGGVEPDVIVPWFQDAAAVAENKSLLAEYAQIIEQLTTAADEVENGIRRLLADTSLVADTEAIPVAAFEASYVEMPWGWPVAEDRNVVESIEEGGRRIGQSLLDTVFPLLGFDTRTWAHSSGYAAQSWLGMGNVLGSLAVTLLLPPDKLGQTPPVWHGWLQERHQMAATLGLAVGIDATAAESGASAYHAWEDDPIATGMEATFNMLTMVAPAAGAARFAGLSARTARWARWAGAGADFVVPGGSFGVAGSVRVVDNLADVVRIGGHLPGVTIRPAGVIDAAADTFSHTPASDHFFDTTTTELPGGASSVDEGVGSGELPSADRTEAVPEPELDGAPPEQPPNDPPTTGGGDDAPDDGAGDDPGDAQGASPVRPELLSPWHPGLVSSVEPLHPDLEWAQTYGSGDFHLPGCDPPRSPEDTFTPGSGGDGWHAEVREVNKPSFQYQMQVSGLRPDANGWLPEYYRTTPDGREISYDGMVMRGDVPVHQEMKNGWDDLAFLPNSPDVLDKLDDWVGQAQDQVAGLPSDGVLEWHLSNPHAAAALHEVFANPLLGLEDVVVLYTPGL